MRAHVRKEFPENICIYCICNQFLFGQWTVLDSRF